MRHERGSINLITFIGVILILTLVLFVLVVFDRFNSQKEANNTTTNTLTNTTVSGGSGTSTATKNDEFTLSFLQMENNQENMIYSPLSIKYALKMLQEGANGNTYDQIEKVAGNLSLPKYQNIGKNLSLANGVFIRDTYYQYVKQSYKDILVSKYNAEIKQDEFKNAKNVNKWIEENTLNIIKNMLKDDQVNQPDLEMLLINALAIDMEWKTKFDCADTYGDTFYLADGTEMNATMMNMETSSDDISYYLGKDVTALTMDLKDYEGTKLEFMAIMPEENLNQYIDSLTMDKIDDITKNLKSASTAKNGVRIKIPKFKFDYDLSLKNDLISLGITDAFNPEVADFSNMADRSLYVSDALHKADIEFTEKGIKAAAVTVFAMMDAAILEPNKPVEINIDKPFVFLIRDKDTKEVWFTGTVYEPNSWENDKAEYTTQW